MKSKTKHTDTHIEIYISFMNNKLRISKLPIFSNKSIIDRITAMLVFYLLTLPLIQ